MQNLTEWEDELQQREGQWHLRSGKVQEHVLPRGQHLDTLTTTPDKHLEQYHALVLQFLTSQEPSWYNIFYMDTEIDISLKLSDESGLL